MLQLQPAVEGLMLSKLYAPRTIDRGAALASWQPSLACSLDDPLVFLAKGWIVGSSCSVLHQ